jgi:hypothetical protein
VLIYSPSFKCTATDESGKVALGETIAWPTGTFLENFGIGKSAAVDFMLHVSGEPSRVWWRITASDFILEVKYPD